MQREMSGLKRIIFAIALSLAVFFCAFLVRADEVEKDADGKYTLVIYDLYGEGDKPVCGVKFTVSKVAELSEKGVFELTGDYKDCDVTNDDINSMELASDVNAVMLKLMDGEIIDPEAVTAKTDETGRIEITGLSAGMYLLTAEGLETEEGLYESSPSLIAIPGNWEGTAQNAITIYAKTSVSYSHETGTGDETGDESQSETSEESSDDESEGTSAEETETSGEDTESGTSSEETESQSDETEASPEETEGQITETENDGIDFNFTSETVADETSTETGNVVSQMISSILTGDNAPVLLLSIIVIVAFIVIIIEIIFAITRRKKNKEEMGEDE